MMALFEGTKQGPEMPLKIVPIHKEITIKKVQAYYQSNLLPFRTSSLNVQTANSSTFCLILIANAWI